MWTVGAALAAWMAGGAVVAAERAASGPEWLTDFEKAKQQSAEKKVPILADFTGSDWCQWCQKLDKEVLSQKAFQDFAKANVVLFMADFPQVKKIPAETKKQNQDLAKKYNVRGFPTILLLDASGNVMDQTGYQAGGAEKYVEHLKQLLSKKPADAKAKTDGAAAAPAK